MHEVEQNFPFFAELCEQPCPALAHSSASIYRGLVVAGCVCTVEEEAHQEATTEEKKDEAEIPMNGDANVPFILSRNYAGRVPQFLCAAGWLWT